MLEVIAQPYRLDWAYDVCRRSTKAEQVVYEALGSEEFDPQAVAARGALLPGQHYVFTTALESIAVGGFVQMSPGVLRTWFLATDAAWHSHGRALTDSVRRVIERTLADGLAHRIETITLAEKAQTRRWYERIGLSYESTLRGYCVDGRDAVMYVALRGAERG